MIPTDERAIEIVSWAETLEHGRLGHEIAEAAVRALREAGVVLFEVVPDTTKENQ